MGFGCEAGAGRVCRIASDPEGHSDFAFMGVRTPEETKK